VHRTVTSHVVRWAVGSKGKLSTLRFVDRKEPQVGNSQDNSDDELFDDDLDDVNDVDDEESEEE